MRYRHSNFYSPAAEHLIGTKSLFEVGSESSIVAPHKKGCSECVLGSKLTGCFPTPVFECPGKVRGIAISEIFRNASNC